MLSHSTFNRSPNNIFHFTLILTLASILSYSQCSMIWFNKIQQCTQNNKQNTQCKTWNTTIEILYNQGVFGYHCFAEDTYVREKYKGMMAIKDISVGDWILAMDFDRHQTVYSQVVAWLHRDTDSVTKMINIETNTGQIYKASAGHNIAYNDNGVIGFKQASEFESSDQLILLSMDSNNNKIDWPVKVANNTRKSNQRGLYSPMTAQSNFYISNTNDDGAQMILVHCLSDVSASRNIEYIVHGMLKVSHYFGLNTHKNLHQQQYLHPITHLLPLISPQKHQIPVLLSTGNNTHLSTQPEISKLYADSLHDDKHLASSSASSNKENKKRSTLMVYAAYDMITAPTLLQ